MKLAVVTFPGTSCEVEMHRAVTKIAGGEAEIVWHKGADLSSYDGVIIPHGASYGDYLRPGALATTTAVADQIVEMANEGKLVVGVGNGFQILVELGLLPGAFLQNPSLRFESGRANVRVAQDQTIFSKGYVAGDVITLPYATQFGTYYNEEEVPADQIVWTYEDNVWNSTQSIAGMTNAKGNVFGTMLLPERAVEEVLAGTDGLPLFESILGSEQ